MNRYYHAFCVAFLFCRAPTAVPEAESILVRGPSVAQFAAEHDLLIVHEPGLSGWAVVEGANAIDAAKEQGLEWSTAARTDGAINLVGIAHLLGVSTLLPDRWYMRQLGLPFHSPLLGPGGGHGRLGLLDSGVAHGGSWFSQNQAPGPLRSVPVTYEADLIDQDQDAQDEHQHGTHLAATMLGRQTQYYGVSPGSELAIIRILDENNRGDEWTLVEGLYEAIQADVDVVNMSVTFPPSYVPSKALLEALHAVHQAGIVMVAASGNDGVGRVAWPAASPRVISVGATSLASSGPPEITPYTNRDSRLDVLAPGGRLDIDANNNGIVDGILAHSISFQQPGTSGLWMGAGTSQAAALTSGVVLRLLADVPPEHIRAVLQAGGSSPGWSVTPGTEVKRIHNMDALRSWRGGVRGAEVSAAILPFLERSRNGANVRPAALVSAALVSGDLPTDSFEIQVQLEGSSSEVLSCRPRGAAASCLVRATSWFSPEDAQGWLLEVTGIAAQQTGVVYRPTASMFVNEGWEVIVDRLEATGRLDDLGLGIQWTPDLDPRLGRVAEGYTLLDLGSGYARSPSGVVLTPPAFEDRTSRWTARVDTGGVAFSTSPMGGFWIDLRTTERWFYGSSNDYNGGEESTYIMLAGSAYGDTPLGWRASDLVVPRHIDVANNLQVNPTRVDLETLHVEGADLSGRAAYRHLRRGGFVIDGREGATDWYTGELQDLLRL